LQALAALPGQRVSSSSHYSNVKVFLNCLREGRTDRHQKENAPDGDSTPRKIHSTPMGGEGQTQSQLAMVTRMVDFGYDVQ
jgi:hypothetical protein